MAAPLSPEDRTLVDSFMTRRGLLRGAAATGIALSAFGFAKTKDIQAQQLTGTSLYDQLGGLVGITAVINTFAGNLAGDSRISAFFTNLPAGRLPRLKELLIQQIANASGGPVTYTGLDMKTAHQGMGVTMANFNALVEDLVAALDSNGVSPEAKTLLLGALAPMASDIVTA